ncbi:hypothetical protein [Flavobacterium yafengii]|jgi:hypothetical protein|uniref:hypothetical protein n=1 Tax=Flavobacterium yafengii TaxID=3041253 RepID=UPI0024A95A4C|nr:hypothetical protein [Flavobacterium yafengii]MDI6045021.1 hypothetical protein [Flavobacterium yafengii]
MDVNFVAANKTENILEENSFFIAFESKVIFKNDKERINLSLNHISNIRIVKNRDLTTNIIISIFSALFYLIAIVPVNDKIVFQLLFLVYVSILFVIFSRIKKYNYKLLINNGKFGFNEIIISENNLFYAKRFLTMFKPNIAKTDVNDGIIVISWSCSS